MLTFMGKNIIQNTKLKGFVLAAFALLAGVWALFPENFVFGSTSVCLHFTLSGIQCPFCGLSRAGYSILHLNFLTAWQLNPLIYLILWLYILEWILLTRNIAVWNVRKISWWAGLVFVLTLYGMRIFEFYSV